MLLEPQRLSGKNYRSNKMTFFFSSQFNYGGFEMKMHVLALTAPKDYFALIQDCFCKSCLVQDRSNDNKKHELDVDWRNMEQEVLYSVNGNQALESFTKFLQGILYYKVKLWQIPQDFYFYFLKKCASGRYHVIGSLVRSLVFGSTCPLVSKYKCRSNQVIIQRRERAPMEKQEQFTFNFFVCFEQIRANKNMKGSY